MSGIVAESELHLARRIAISAYQAFRYAMHNVGPRNQPLPSWDDLPEEAQDGWFRAVFVVKAETEEVTSVPWTEIAQRAYEVYAKAVGAGSVLWSTLDPKQQVAWEAAARHILTLFEFEAPSEEDIESMEAEWATWSTKRGNNE